MSVTLNNSDFQCLQDQLLELKTKNYELAEKNRRSQADFEAAKAKICSLQLKLEEQERDFQVTSTTLRREIEAVTGGDTNSNKDVKDSEDYRAKYKKLLHKAKELQQRYEKSLEVVQQLDGQNKIIAERVRKLDDDNQKLKEQLEAKNQHIDEIDTQYQEKLKLAIEECKSQRGQEEQKCFDDLAVITQERDNLKKQVDLLTAEVDKFDTKLESQLEQMKIHERKGVQIVKELKRQLSLEKGRAETLRKRLESILSQPPVATATELESQAQLSTSSSTNGNSSSNGKGSRANQDANSVGSWSFVPVKSKSNENSQLPNETISLCSIDSEGCETVQQPCDAVSEDSIQLVASGDSASRQNFPTAASSTSSSFKVQEQQVTQTRDLGSFAKHTLSSTPNSPGSIAGTTAAAMMLEEQAALVDRITRLQHDKWTLEEKLSYMEQANCSLTEDLANKTSIIKQYFMDQAMRSSQANSSHNDSGNVFDGVFSMSNNSTRRPSFPGNMNQLLADKPSLKKVVEFLKEKSHVSSADNENISREATKKMQLMLEETLIKCLKLQENLDYVTSELNKLKN